MAKNELPIDQAFAEQSRVAVHVDWRNSKAVAALLRAMPKILSPDLLSSKYAAENAEMAALNPTMGHCSVSAEAVWHIIGGNASPYRDHWAYDTPAARRRQKNGQKRAKHDETHHWLQIPGTKPAQRNAIIDPTAAQYKRIRMVGGGVTSSPIPYPYGTATGFMTRFPSARAQCVIDRLALHFAANPVEGISVSRKLIRDTEASRDKPFRAADFSRQPEFYRATLAPKKVRSATP